MKAFSRAPSALSGINDACRQAYLLRWALGPVETLCILGRNVKSVLVLERKEHTNCSPWTTAFFATQNSVVSTFLSTICFTFNYVRYWCESHKVYSDCGATYIHIDIKFLLDPTPPERLCAQLEPVETMWLVEVELVGMWSSQMCQHSKRTWAKSIG